MRTITRRIKMTTMTNSQPANWWRSCFPHPNLYPSQAVFKGVSLIVQLFPFFVHMKKMKNCFLRFSLKVWKERDKGALIAQMVVWIALDKHYSIVGSNPTGSPFLQREARWITMLFCLPGGLPSRSPDSSDGRVNCPWQASFYRGFKSHQVSIFWEALWFVYVILAPRRTTIKEPW